MASYDKPNVETVAEILALSPKAQKEAWAALNVRKSNDYSFMYDNMVGSLGSGKPFIQHNDLTVREGNTVNIVLLGATRGKGVQGNSQRVGQEKKLKPKNFSFTVGRFWHGYAIDSVAAEETMIGTAWDKNASAFLQKVLGIKKTDDMLMELRARATLRNTIRPNNKATREALRSVDVFTTTTVKRAKAVATSLGAKPVKIGRSSAGAEIRQFMVIGTQFGLESFENSQAYLDAVTNSDVRGAMNGLFTGNILPWDGNAIYRWDVEDPEDTAPAGCPLLRRAFLGTAIAAGTTAVDVTGGGSAENAADTDVQYFGYFSNSQYVGCEGEKIAVDTTTVRYGMIQHQTGANAGSVFIFSYKINNGNKLTIFERLGPSNSGAQKMTIGNMAYGAGTIGGNNVPIVDSAPIGSLIVEVNSYGVPFCEQLAVGEMAGVMGHGSIDGSQAIGKRTEVANGNHNMDNAIGLETVFGSRAFERIDSQPGGYVLIESALSLPGFPII